MTSDKWYALHIYYGGPKKVLRIKDLFDGDSIETFVPMKYSGKCDPDNPQVQLKEPALNDLIMYRGKEETLKKLKERHKDSKDLIYVNFKHHSHGDSKGRPIVVPDAQMKAFMNHVKGNEESIAVLDYEQLLKKKGRPVEVIAGQFKGVRGTLMRIEKNRHVVVVLPGLMGAKLPHIPVTNLRFVEEYDSVHK